VQCTKEFLREDIPYQCIKQATAYTRSSATAKSTARPSYLVGALYDIYWETNNRSTANQPLLHNWPQKLPNSGNNAK